MTDPRVQPDLQREFPLRCVLKVIALDLDGLQQRLDECLLRLDHPARALPGNQSTSGKYITYNIDIEFLTLDSMRFTINELRTVHGVRVVL